MLKKLSLYFVLACTLCHSATAIETSAKQAFMVDMDTGTVLLNKQADEPMPPSSMSKLMTVYVAFSRIANGRLKLDDKLPVSEKAWRKQGSKTFVRLGEDISVEELLNGIIVQSGNDACIVLAEAISGSEDAFAKEMNKVAKDIGLKIAIFVNSTGWPDENHLMTARDLATLSQRLITDFPEHYKYFSVPKYTYSGIPQHNRNPLLGGSQGVDGLKTGHTEIAGYGITLSAKKDGRRLILVVNGLSSEKERKEEGRKLLGYGFREFKNHTLLKTGQKLADAKVWFGKQTTVPLIASKTVMATIPNGGAPDISFKIKYVSPVPAPIKKNQHIADLSIQIKEQEPITLPLLAGSNVAKAAGFSKIKALFNYYTSE